MGNSERRVTNNVYYPPFHMPNRSFKPLKKFKLMHIDGRHMGYGYTDRHGRVFIVSMIGYRINQYDKKTGKWKDVYGETL